MARKTPRSHPGPVRGLGYCDRTRDRMGGQRARSVGSSCRNSAELDRRPTVERRSLINLRPWAADFDLDTGCRRQRRLRFGGAGDHSAGEFSRRRKALPNRSYSRYVPRWSRYLFARGALGRRQVAGFPVTHQDRPVGPVHRLCRVGAAGSSPASRAQPRLRRDLEPLCGSDQGLKLRRATSTTQLLLRPRRCRPRCSTRV
jgi:hypothetical protein